MNADQPSALNGRLPPHRLLDEPLLVFNTGAQPLTHHHPLLGLLTHGPYSPPPAGTEPIRIATITMQGQTPRLRKFLSDLRQPWQPTDRKPYVPPFPGFASVFGADLVPAAAPVHIELSRTGPGNGLLTHEHLAHAVARAVDHLNLQRDQWDVIVFLLPRAWESLRTSPDGSLDLHDRIKASAAPLGCPVQMLREESALNFRHFCSLAWRLSIALFTKAGGIPFRMSPPSPVDTAYVGLSYAIRGGTRSDFVTCCSQVFDAAGGGLEFIAYNVGADRDLDNPHLSREEMRAVMARSARLYQHRHAGNTPQRLVVHKTTPWRPDEVDGVLDAWPAVADIECVNLQGRTPWRAVALDADPRARSKPSQWPVQRGTLQYLSGTEALLWVTGTAPRMSLSGRAYNSAVKGLPTPMLIRRDAGSGPLEGTAAEILALSKLDWNNDAPFGTDPVTIGYSQRLARIISHAPDMPDGIYQFRLFM